MTELEKIVYDTVMEIQRIKADNKELPDFATQREIYNSFKVEILTALRSLYLNGLIVHRHTVNGENMFGIKR